jgi:hypothetical protein
MLLPFELRAAENPSGSGPETQQPTREGVRFTPGMARAFATQLAENVIAPRYELDEGKKQEAVEVIARRMMAAAHANDGQYQPALEKVMAEVISARAERGERRGPPRFNREQMKEVGEQLLPLMPAFREMVTGIGQDIAPMLPLKQQLKFAGDMMAANAGIEGFQKNLQRWASGEGDPERPFTDERPIQKDASGESQYLAGARREAQRNVQKPIWGEWQEYLEEAKKFYGFDESQVAVAESVLREYTTRAQAYRPSPQALDRLYRNRLWATMLNALRLQPPGPLRALLEEEHRLLLEPGRAMEAEFKDRIDQIPTDAQRTSAMQRMAEILETKGVKLDE